MWVKKVDKVSWPDGPERGGGKAVPSSHPTEAHSVSITVISVHGSLFSRKKECLGKHGGSLTPFLANNGLIDEQFYRCTSKDAENAEMRSKGEKWGCGISRVNFARETQERPAAPYT